MIPKRVYAEINLDNLIYNIENVKKKTNTEVMAIIKTDAYGHGAVECAKVMNEHDIFNFGVATADEAIELRQNGIKGRILVIGFAFDDNYEELINNDITLTVFDYDTAERINNIGKKAKIHIKVDTGMGRIGFQPNEESLDVIKRIDELENITIDGMFTHFACADMKDKTSFNKQKKIFLDFTSKVKNNGIKIPVKHMCNSAAIMDYDGDYLDMVRSGIITYGLYPSDEVIAENLPMKPVMSLRSHIAHVKKVSEGFTVSYGSTFVTDRETVIATVPVGYGDGYPRSLSNLGKVIINGKLAPIIGRVCMDQMMVDVTNVPDVKRGDQVTLWGTDGNLTISVEELAELCGRFNYEFVCDINKRVKRIYIKDGEIK